MYAEYDPSLIVQRVFKCEREDIAPIVVLGPAPAYVAPLVARLSRAKNFGAWFTGVSGYLDNDIFLTLFDNTRYAPGVADCTYFLQFANVENILFHGAIGGLGKDMALGDLILPSSAQRGEGASSYFAAKDEQALANSKLLEIARSKFKNAATKAESTIHEGAIFTTDSLAAETMDFLTELQNQGILGIEMETSALYMVAQKFGIRALSITTVSDLPLSKKSLFDNIDEKEKEKRKSAQSYITDALAELAKTLSE